MTRALFSVLAALALAAVVACAQHGQTSKPTPSAPQITNSPIPTAHPTATPTPIVSTVTVQSNLVVVPRTDAFTITVSHGQIADVTLDDAAIAAATYDATNATITPREAGTTVVRVRIGRLTYHFELTVQ